MIYYTRSCRELRVSCYLDQVVSEGARLVWCQFGEIVEHLVSDYQQPRGEPSLQYLNYIYFIPISRAREYLSNE